MPELTGGVECAAVVLLSDFAGQSRSKKKRALLERIALHKPEALLCTGKEALQLGRALSRKAGIPAFYVAGEEAVALPKSVQVLCQTYRNCCEAIDSGADPSNIFLYDPADLASALEALMRRCGKRDGIVLCGAYGMGNLGDDAILDAILSDLRKVAPDDRITVLCRNPGKMRRAHCVNTIFTFNFLKYMGALRSARLFISGGGTLITDNTSTRSLFYYLATIFLARRAGVKVMLYGCGIGPFSRPFNRKAAARILNRCADLITTRDDVSAELLAAMSVTAPKIIRAADPAFEIASNDLDLSGEQDLVASVTARGRYAVFAPRSWNDDGEILPRIAEAADRLYTQQGLVPVLLPMAYPVDCPTLRRLRTMISAPAVVVDKAVTYRTALALIDRADLVVGMRLHALIFAAVAGVPSVGISYDIKVKSFMEYINSGHCAEYDCLTAETLCHMAEDALSRPAASVDHLHARCTVNADAVRALLEGENRK